MWSLIDFNTEDFDTHGFHDPAASSRLTVPSGQDGRYLVIGCINFNSHATGYRAVNIDKNGSPIGFMTANAVSGSGTFVPILLVLPLVAGNYLTVTAFQNSGAALNVSAASYYQRNWLVDDENRVTYAD